MFQNSPARSIIEKYLSIDLGNDLSQSCFSGDLLDLRYAEKHFLESRHWIRPYAPKKGLGQRLGLRSYPQYPREWDALIGKYGFSKNGVGMLPLVIRAMQNNLKSSIESVEFMREGDAMFFIYTECGEAYKLEIGFSDFKESVIDVRGEKYIVRVMGEAMEDEDRNMLYKLELLFPELPNTRMLKLSFTEEDKLVMRMSELPNEKIAGVFLKEFNGTNPKMTAYMDVIERRIGKNTTGKRMIDTFAPTLIGARIGSENYNRIMEEEKERSRASERTSKIVDTIVDKLLRDEEEEQGVRGFLGEIADRIKMKLPKRTKGKSASCTDESNDIEEDDAEK